MVEFGLGLQTDKTPADYARLAARAESLGFDVVSVFGDLLYQPPIGPLLDIARATSRVRLGAACWNPTTLHPYEIAGQVAYLDAVSGGRAYVGLARGTWLGALGLDRPTSIAGIRAAVALIRALLSGSAGGLADDTFPLAPGTTLRYSLPARLPPVLIGTWGPRLLALAGEIADEVKVGGTANPALVPVVRERLATDRPVGIVVGAVTVVDSDRAAARARARTEVAMYLDVVAELDPTVTLDPALLDAVRADLATGDARRAGSHIPDDILDLFAFAGTPDDVAGQARRLLDAGVARIDFGTPQGLTTDDGIALLGTAVLPMLR